MKVLRVTTRGGGAKESEGEPMDHEDWFASRTIRLELITGWTLSHFEGDMWQNFQYVLYFKEFVFGQPLKLITK